MNDQYPVTAEDWRPTCDIAVLRLRAALIRSLREFFDSEGYLEVETPLMSSDVVVDAHINPFAVSLQPKAPAAYLQTSPEAAMKRLLAAGSGSIYQFTKSFRQSERGSQHNPEFTMLEWYGVGTSCFEQMEFTERLFRVAVETVSNGIEVGSPPSCLKQPFTQVSYADAFQRVYDCNPLDASEQELKQAFLANSGCRDLVAEVSNRDDLLNVMLAEHVEPELGREGGEFLHNYPLSQAALAIRCPDDPRTARRFELYVQGMEFCNGYEELTDADELSVRETEQNRLRQSNGQVPLPGARRMTDAMRAGLPACSGVALGLDRLVIYLTGAERIDQVIPFPIERA